MNARTVNVVLHRLKIANVIRAAIYTPGNAKRTYVHPAPVSGMVYRMGNLCIDIGTVMNSHEGIIGSDICWRSINLSETKSKRSKETESAQLDGIARILYGWRVVLRSVRGLVDLQEKSLDGWNIYQTRLFNASSSHTAGSGRKLYISRSCTMRNGRLGSP